MLFDQNKWIWITLLGVAPLAYFAGLKIQTAAIPSGPPMLTVDRVGAIAAAREYVLARGFSTEGWRELVTLETDRDAYRYLASHPGPARNALEALTSPATVLVTFLGTQSGNSIKVWLDTHGKGYGFQTTVADNAIDPRTQSDSEQARRIADTAFDLRFPDKELFIADSPKIDVIDRKGKKVKLYRYSWKLRATALAQLDLRYGVEVLGGRIFRDSIAVGASDELKGQFERGFFFNIFLWAFRLQSCFMIVFVLLRYFKRSEQKEVSRGRALSAALIATTFLGIIIFSIDLMAVELSGGSGEIPAIFLYVIFPIMVMVFGALAGAAYAATEGDLRELYPNKLTSIDALLMGNVFSRIVARPVVTGGAAGGILFGLHSLVLYYGGGPTLPLEMLTNVFDSALSRWPAPLFIADPAFGASLVSLIAFIVPLAAFHRLVRRPRIRLACLVPSLLAGFLVVQNIWLPTSSAFVAAFLRLGTLLAAFWFADFLSCIVAITAFNFALMVVGILQTTGHSSDSLTAVIVGVLGLFAVELWFAWRGIPVSDSDVRPKYARDIDERISLQSELSAAREAQVRLLPVAPPVIPGLSISALCHAAETVQGDFYDFFQLSPTRLGILITDGGGQGLTSALFIAFAKGFLMNQSHVSHHAGETLRSLGDAMSELLAGGSLNSGICYAVIDSADQTLHYARTGDTPRLILDGEGSRQVPERTSSVFPCNGQPLWEGSIQIQEGLRILLHTDGLTKHRRPDFQSAEDWLKQPRRKRWFQFRKKKLVDDITVVTIRVVTSQSIATERAA